MSAETRLPISVCMIAGPEAGRIRRSLESVVTWTSEIIVVVNEDVSDGTDEIAKTCGATVFREPWKGHIAQKNSAAAKATQSWLLGLDADEVVSPELRREITELFANSTRLASCAAFSFPRLTTFCGKWIRHGDWYPDRGTRLWRKGAAEWGGVDPHDKLMVRGKTGKLCSNLLHYNAAKIDNQIAKISSYSDDFVRDALKRRATASWPDMAIRPCWRFFRGYVVRLGFLDGWQGLYIAWMTAFYSATRYAKLRHALKSSNESEK
jgi:glycosyltransferase involved in cell wall biosynthesis